MTPAEKQALAFRAAEHVAGKVTHPDLVGAESICRRLGENADATVKLIGEAKALQGKLNGLGAVANELIDQLAEHASARAPDLALLAQKASLEKKLGTKAKAKPAKGARVKRQG